jgi:hypothetical protein
LFYYLSQSSLCSFHNKLTLTEMFTGILTWFSAFYGLVCSSHGTGMAWLLDNLGIKSQWAWDFLCRPDWPQGPFSFLYSKCWVLLRVKWPECGADHAPPSSTEVQMGWNYTSASPLYLPRHVMEWPSPK